MPRRTILFGFVFLFTLSFLPPLASAAYKPEYKLSVVVAQNNPWGGGAQKFADLVRERTGGKINIKCYFAGQLFAGMQTNEFLITRQGVGDFAVGSTINWSPTFKEMNLFSLPFFSPTIKHLTPWRRVTREQSSSRSSSSGEYWGWRGERMAIGS